MTDLMGSFTIETFKPHLNTQFVITLVDADGKEIPYPLTLIEASPLGDVDKEHGPDERVAFSLIFSHPDTTQHLLQNTYHLDHPAFTDLLLFIVPLGPRSEAMCYEAIIS